jgi:hypothetical protein
MERKPKGSCAPVVDVCRNYEQVIFLDLDADPSLVVAVYRRLSILWPEH